MGGGIRQNRNRAGWVVTREGATAGGRNAAALGREEFGRIDGGLARTVPSTDNATRSGLHPRTDTGAAVVCSSAAVSPWTRISSWTRAATNDGR